VLIRVATIVAYLPTRCYSLYHARIYGTCLPYNAHASHITFLHHGYSHALVMLTNAYAWPKYEIGIICVLGTSLEDIPPFLPSPQYFILIIKFTCCNDHFPQEAIHRKCTKYTLLLEAIEHQGWVTPTSISPCHKYKISSKTHNIAQRRGPSKYKSEMLGV
jgi:hypothetical protein